MAKSRGQYCGDIELTGYLANAVDPVPLVLDLRIALSVSEVGLTLILMDTYLVSTPEVLLNPEGTKSKSIRIGSLLKKKKKERGLFRDVISLRGPFFFIKF